MNKKAERFIFDKREHGMYEVRLRADAPENPQERSIYIGMAIGKAQSWSAESVHSNVRSLGVFRTRELAGDRLLTLAQEQGRI